jgi:arabinofuranosyltransferase
MSLLLLLGVALSDINSRRARRMRIILAVAAGFFVVARAIDMAWVADESYVSFRYAQNLANGHGLVFNPGERVGGLGSSLWAILLSVAIRLGIGAPHAAVFLGISSLVGLLWVTGRSSTAEPSADASGVFPIAAILLASSYVFACYGSSGLPTMASALLVLLCFTALRNDPVRAGIFGALAVLTTPLCIVLTVALCIDGLARENRKKLLRFAVPHAALLLLALLLHRSYYGQALPHYFYTDSFWDSRLERGLGYVLLGFLGHGYWSLLPAVLVALYYRKVARIPSGALFAGCAYLAAVMWSGGDEMDGHLLIIILPGLLIAAERGMLLLWQRQRRLWAIFATALPGVLVIPNVLLRPGMVDGQLVDAAHFDRTKASRMTPSNRCQTQARELSRAFDNSSVRPRIASSCAGVIAYMSSLPVVDLSGDADRHMAEHQMEWGNRRVRDKNAHAEYLIGKGVDLSEVRVWPSRYASLFEVAIGDLTLNLVRYRKDIVDQIRRTSGTRVGTPAQFATSYAVNSESPVQACDLWFLNRFYFAEGRKGERADFLAKLSLSGNTAPFYAMGDSDAPPGWVSMPLDYQGSQEWVHQGLSLSDWLSGDTPEDHVDITSKSIWLIDTYRPLLKNTGRGRLQSPEFELHGEVITVEVGGGMNEQELFVGLLVDGQIVRRASGCDSDVMRRHVWDVSAFAGKRARLLWVDENVGDWGHLLAGEIKQWRRVRVSPADKP